MPVSRRIYAEAHTGSMHRGAALALTLIVASLLATEASAAKPACLALVGSHPVTLHGRGFASRERVRVVVRAVVTVSRYVRTDASGAFTTRFDRISVPRCGGVFARARGSTGTVASLKIPLPACMPAVEP